MKARLSTDGGARGNPGPAAYGYVLEAEDGHVLAAHGEAIGHATNNVAEYSGLVAGLAKAAELGVRAASLYYHVQDKEQLLDLLADGLTWDTRKLTGSGGEKSSASADVCRAIADTYPNIAGLMTMMAGGDTHKLFEFGVERIIDGLRTRLPAEPES